ncbi:MAG: glycosyltransferase family 4 protein [Lachnospiraceae bacterium]|nr:glycosyltransferase family 4 protein [Lachnospiraceae bacterium]
MQKSSPKFIFVSNYINHHQIPFCNAMYKLLDGDFAFCQTEEVEQERVNMGWEAGHELPYLIRYGEKPGEYQEQIDNAQVVFFGGTDEESYIQHRLQTGKTVIRYSERIYKTGQWKAISPRGLRKKYLDHTRYRKEPVYMLCSGAYVPSDFHIVRAYPEKMLKWGYFPETKHYDVDKLLGEKTPGTILWAARMIDWKHPDLPIRVAKYLKEQKLSFRMNIIGGGELEQSMKQLAEELGVSDVVDFLGFQKPEEVRHYMENSDIYLVTSDRREGWGAVVNEAMNSGCVVVANHMIGAVPYLIKHGENGFIYKDGDQMDLCTEVERLLTNRELCRRLGREAYRTITALWNPENAAFQLAGFCMRQGFLTKEDLPGIGDGEAAMLQKIPMEGPCSVARVISENKMYATLVKK